MAGKNKILQCYDNSCVEVLQLEKLDGNIGKQVPEVHMGKIAR